MTCTEFLNKIDAILNGQLDVVEARGFEEHRRECRMCGRLASRQFLTGLRHGIFAVATPQRCLSESTLLRLVTYQLSAMSEELAWKHVNECTKCYLRAETLAVHCTEDEESGLIKTVQSDSEICTTPVLPSEPRLPESKPKGLAARSQKKGQSKDGPNP